MISLITYDLYLLNESDEFDGQTLSQKKDLVARMRLPDDIKDIVIDFVVNRTKKSGGKLG